MNRMKLLIYFSHPFSKEDVVYQVADGPKKVLYMLNFSGLVRCKSHQDYYTLLEIKLLEKKISCNYCPIL